MKREQREICVSAKIGFSHPKGGHSAYFDEGDDGGLVGTGRNVESHGLAPLRKQLLRVRHRWPLTQRKITRNLTCTVQLNLLCLDTFPASLGV